MFTCARGKKNQVTCYERTTLIYIAAESKNGMRMTENANGEREIEIGERERENTSDVYGLERLVESTDRASKEEL